MSENIYNQRIDYTKNNFLEENNLPDNPFELFHGWYKVALDQVDKDPNAMILSTLKDGRPRARVVLVKNLDEAGLLISPTTIVRKFKRLILMKMLHLLFSGEA